LKFLLKDFLHELVSFGAEEVIKVVEGTTVLGGVHNEIAFAKQGIEPLVEKIVNGEGRERGFGLHNVHPCKKLSVQTLYKNPQIFNTPDR
jgi:hypothetical protein